MSTKALYMSEQQTALCA